MSFVNLTPHEINIHRIDGSILTLPSAGVARVSTETVPCAPVEGIATFSTVLGAPVGLPSPVDGTTLIVSGMVLDHPALSGRTDLAAPGELVRNEQGQPVGCRGLRVTAK